MTSPGTLRYHHDRGDLRGVAVLAFVAGLVLLAIALPIVHGAVADDAALIVTGVVIALWCGVWGGYGYRARTARGREETVAVDATGFESRLFGRVAFADVQDHATGHDIGLLRWEISAPSLTLKLSGRRRLHFHLDKRHYRQDLLDYVAFIDAALAGIRGERAGAAALPGCGALFDGLDRTAVPTGPGTGHSTRDHAADRAPDDARPARSRPRRGRRRQERATRTNTSQTGPASDRQAASDLSRANEAARHRFREQMVRHRKWIVLASVLLPLSYSIRACDPGFIKSIVDPSPFQGMKERAPVVLEHTTGLLQRAVAQQGPVYAWTRADNANLKPVLAPNVNARHIGNDMLDMMSTANSITEFLINDEAEGYRMGLQHDGTITLSSYSAISLRPVAGEHTLSFFLLAPDDVTSKDLGGRTPPQLSWRIRYRDVADIPKQLDQLDGQLPMPIIVRWLKMTPAPRLVMTASRYQGMTADDFQAAVEAVQQDFHHRGIDTKGYEVTRFEDGTVDKTRAAAHAQSDNPDAANKASGSQRSVAPDAVE